MLDPFLRAPVRQPVTAAPGGDGQGGATTLVPPPTVLVLLSTAVPRPGQGEGFPFIVWKFI